VAYPAERGKLAAAFAHRGVAEAYRHLRWITSAAETAPLAGPYALVTAGAALHWMAWKPTLARLRTVMTGGAFLAIVEHGPRDLPWHEAVTEVIIRHSRSPGYDPGFSLVEALAADGLLEIAGRAETAPARFRQPLACYVEQFHSTASLAREWMTAGEAAAFDRAVTDAVAPYAEGGMLDMAVVAQVAWGRPGHGSAGRTSGGATRSGSDRHGRNGS
jgi:hypothetical protein